MSNESMIDRVELAICNSADRANDEQLSWSELAAKAAIEAMREPTEAMLDAGAYDLDMSLEQQWERMIDAALNDA